MTNLASYPEGSRTRLRAWLLGIAASAFAAWIGWLAFLVLATSRPIVLSRAQFLVSSLDVIAVVHDGKGTEARVEQVHWPKTAAAQRLEGMQISVANLRQCEGWEGPGEYILPLAGDGKGGYQVVPTPPSPGFEPSLAGPAGRPRVYRLTKSTQRQLELLKKPPVPAPPPPATAARSHSSEHTVGLRTVAF